MPKTRTVNGKPLEEDISLTAEDVGAAGAGHTHTAEEVGAVPAGRSINGKPLSEDITLTADDVGAAPANHTHTSDGLSQDAADDRYLKLSGGALTGPVSVQPPTSASSPATKEYVDRGAPFCKTFEAGTWSSDGTISIPQSEHGRAFSNGIVLMDAYMLVSGRYIKTWASQTTYASYESQGRCGCCGAGGPGGVRRGEGLGTAGEEIHGPHLASPGFLPGAGRYALQVGGHGVQAPAGP